MPNIMKGGGEIADPPLRMVEGIDLVRLKPLQSEDHHDEHRHDPGSEDEMLWPTHLLGGAFDHLLVGKEVKYENPQLHEPLGEGRTALLPLVNSEPVHAKGVREEDEEGKENHEQREVGHYWKHVLQTHRRGPEFTEGHANSIDMVENDERENDGCDEGKGSYMPGL